MSLSNRFPEKVAQFWIGWYECMYPIMIHRDTGRVEYCCQNHADAIHHIISPTAKVYVKGKHNESVFNSCKLNNENCHLYKPIQNEYTQKALLNRTKEIVLEKVDNREYQLDDNDYDFLRIYAKCY